MNKDLIEQIERYNFKFMGEEKKKFLINICNNSPKKTTQFYLAAMRYVDKAERNNSREWMYFTESMLENALRDMNATSLNSLTAMTTAIKDYLEATTPNTTDFKIGHIKTLQLDSEELKKYVNAIGQQLRYVTQDEFDNIIFKQTGDPLGKAIFILLYHGVKGKSFSDIYELKIEDINFDTGEIYREDKLLAVIPLKYMDIIKEASEEDIFTIYDEEGNIDKERTLTPPTGYLIRRVQCGSNSYRLPDRTVVARLLRDYSKSVNNNYLDGQSVYNSGDVYRLIEWCGMKMPTNKQWREWKEITGSTLSYATTFTAAKIILEKLGLLDESEVME